MKTVNITQESTFNGHPVYCNQDGLHCEILEAIEKLMENMKDQHSKVFMMMFGLNYPLVYPYSTDDNTNISRFIDSFNAYFKREKINSRYIWVREQNKSQRCHYHCCYILNGSVTQAPHKHMERAKTLWAGIIGDDTNGLVQYPETSHMVFRTNLDSFNSAFEHISYMAKVYSKGTNIQPNQRQFGSSRV